MPRRDAARDDGRRGRSCCLSPACASFDQFKNFEVRGEAFRQAVQRFEGVKPIGGTQLMLSRLDRSPVADWWWTVDRWFLAAFLSLMGLGIVLSFAASPAVAERIGLDSFHFATRQIVFMSRRWSRCSPSPSSTRARSGAWRWSCSASSLVLMVAVLFVGVEVKGARRWLSLAGVSRAAVGIPEARLRRHLRLAVRRAQAPARHSGQPVRHAPARRWSSRCWWRSPTSARPSWSSAPGA